MTGPASARLLVALTLFAAALATFAIGCGSGAREEQQSPASAPALIGAQPTAAGGKPIEVGGRPLFADWPKENPDLVIVVSGQMFGYLSPCGCSRPQFGGLERRYNLIQSLKAKGWDVIGVDVGDLSAAPGKGLTEQTLKKYSFAMRALADMGYVAVGVGKTDFQNDLVQLLGQYTVGNPGKRPVVLAANVAGVQRDATGKVTKATAREVYFQGEKPTDRPLVEDVEVVSDKKVSVGVIGVVGPSVGAEVVGLNNTLDFEKTATVLPAALKKLAADKANPELKVLLYQGTQLEAMQVAKDFPDIQLIVRIGDDTESVPKLFPEKVGNTQIVMIGHKGMNVGLVGVFKTAKGLDLRYQLVPLGEEHLTPEKPEELALQNKALQLLEQYTKEVKDAGLMAKVVAKREKGSQHPVQVQNPKADLKYVGAQACAKCHAAEFKKWSETKHSHATEALGPKYAKRPGLRQYDPECINCHSTGFDFATGYENEEKTKHLMHNGCENCHGPGSGHAAKPDDKDLLKALSPWKLRPDDKLPDKAFLEKMAAVPPAERGRVAVEPRFQRLNTAISGQVCMKCHDGDNDPHFDFWTYIPKIYHSGLKSSDLPDGIGDKKKND
jgi:hypothetical protein